MKDWNKGKVITETEAKLFYRNMWIKDHTHSSGGQFWGCCGQAGGDKSWIQLKNTRYLQHQKDNEEYMARHGYPKNIGTSFGATTYHELGHAICNMVLGSGMFGEYKDTVTMDKVREIRRKHNKTISLYAGTNNAEYIAECFASHYIDGTNEQANEVFNLILGKYREKYAR